MQLIFCFDNNISTFELKHLYDFVYIYNRYSYILKHVYLYVDFIYELIVHIEGINRFG